MVGRGILCALAATWAGSWVAAQDVMDREYAIKAAYLYQFSNYVEWPAQEFESSSEPFVIGVFRQNPFGTNLERIASKKDVKGRRIEVRVIRTAADARDCHILFVPVTVPAADQLAVLRETVRHPVLVVGEADDFVTRGGNVQFYLEGNKVRFAFGADSIKRDDLKVSSKLMTLAKIISVK